MIDKALILDLDDTIFPTNSMDNKLFEPFFNDLIQRLNPLFDQMTMSDIVSDLWERPMDNVIKKYQIPKETVNKSLQILNDLDLDLKINTFSDYNYLNDNNTPQFLITKCIVNLQKAKIKALGIEHDFVEIVIIDSNIDLRTKTDLFSDLIKKHSLIPEKTYVIGDNPDSEIKAGNDLNMITIQILRENVQKGNNAAYFSVIC